MKNRFDEIRNKINSRAIRPFANSLPWPYNGMVNDILGAIQTGGNYLAAMGLSSYTEICGRHILFNGDNSKPDSECYKEFIKYMGAGEILNKKIKYNKKKRTIKNAVRDGLVHRYFMKVGTGAVAMYSLSSEAKRTGFLIKEPDSITLVVIPYFNLFCAALKKAKIEGKLNWHPEYTHSVSADELQDGDKDFQKEVLEAWFLSHYENPAESTPYVSAEGGYIYIWGGPFDAEEQLNDEFGDFVPEETIYELAKELEDREGCHEWAGIPEADDIDDYVLDAIISNTKFHESFQRSIESIKALLAHEVNDGLKRNYYMLLYVNVISVMETYLCDAFINKVIGDEKLLRKFVETSSHFSDQKVQASDIYNKMENINDEVKRYLLDLIWHNLKRIKPIYKDTLDVDFPHDVGDIFRDIMKRHDIVHRNGKTKNGQEITIDKADVEGTIDKISEFIDAIDEQLAMEI